MIKNKNKNFLATLVAAVVCISAISYINFYTNEDSLKGFKTISNLLTDGKTATKSYASIESTNGRSLDFAPTINTLDYTPQVIKKSDIIDNKIVFQGQVDSSILGIVENAVRYRYLITNNLDSGSLDLAGISWSKVTLDSNQAFSFEIPYSNAIDSAIVVEAEIDSTFDGTINTSYQYIVDGIEPQIHDISLLEDSILKGNININATFNGTSILAENKLHSLNITNPYNSEDDLTLCRLNPLAKPSDNDPGNYICSLDTTLYADGNYFIRFNASDKAGNIFFDIRNIIIDNTKPIVAINNKITSDTTPEISGSIQDITASTVKVTINGVEYEATVNGGNWIIADNVISNLVNGTYDVKAVATDLAGNIGEDTTVGELIIDTQVPVFELNDISLNEIVSAVPAINVKSNPENFPITCNPTVSVENLQLTANQASKAVYVTCQISDLAGNVAQDTYVIVVNNVAPLVSISASPNTTVVEGNAITLTANPSKGNSPYTYKWSGNCSGTSKSASINKAKGSYSCTVKVTDKDGDTVSATKTVTFTEKTTTTTPTTPTTETPNTDSESPVTDPKTNVDPNTKPDTNTDTEIDLEQEGTVQGDESKTGASTTCKDTKSLWWITLAMQGILMIVINLIFISNSKSKKKSIFWLVIPVVLAIVSQLLHLVLPCNCSDSEWCKGYWLFNMIIGLVGLIFYYYTLVFDDKADTPVNTNHLGMPHHS